VSSGTFEVIVVDNASTDATSNLLQEIEERSANLRVVTETELGLSAARNRAINEAAAPIVAFIDDDAEAKAGWLEALIDAHAAFPTAVAVGGPIELVWSARPPSWVSPRLEEFFSGLDLGTERRTIAYPTLPFGTNMSLDASLARQVGGFDPRLGRRGTDLQSYEEIDLFARLSTVGPIVYAPEARVLHHVSAERAKPTWIARRSFANARSEIVWRDRDRYRSRLELFRLSIASAARVGLNLVRGAVAGTRKDSAGVVESFAKAAHAAGTIAGIARVTR
jgi:GT2 family glycosyltransferase